jgi:choline dehydrogenase-like flavoprotein
MANRPALAVLQASVPKPEDPLAPYAVLPRKPLLTAPERRLWLRMAQVAMPAGERVTAPTAETIDRFDRLLAGAMPAAVTFLRLAAWLFEWIAVVYRFYGSRFSKLDDARADRYLDAWAHNPISLVRLFFRGAISPLKMIHYGDPTISRAVGYDPPAETPCAHPPQRTVELDGRRTVPRGPSQPSRLRCEVAVIGSGAGGATIAKELAERGRDVVILEEGEYFTRDRFTRRPVEMTALLYRDLGMTTALGRVGIPVPIGRTVGGTTTINSGTCFRVPGHVLQHWRDAGDISITDEDLRPFYERAEAFIDVQPVPEEVIGNSARLVRKGAAKLGLHGQPLRRNARHCQGSGVCCWGCPTDAKRSANVTWIPAALDAGARLLPGARVERIDLYGQRRRVLAVRDGRPIEIDADAAIVSCGTLLTPSLLRRSGLRHGELGRNVSIHPAAKLAGLFDDEVRGWEGVPQGFGIHDLHREGILFEGIFTPPEFGALSLAFVGPELTRVMERYRHMAAFGFMIEDRSVGVLREAPDGRPLLFYELGDAEMQKLRRAIDVLARIFFAAGANEVFVPVGGFESIRSESELERFAKARIRPAQVEASAFHPLGSCRLSRDPSRGVVDVELEAHDAARLFVCDGSVFPSSLGVNPQLTIMAFAQRAAAHVDARLSGAARAG